MAAEPMRSAPRCPGVLDLARTGSDAEPIHDLVRSAPICTNVSLGTDRQAPLNRRLLLQETTLTRPAPHETRLYPFMLAAVSCGPNICGPIESNLTVMWPPLTLAPRPKAR